jgi:hypothetical protein
MNDFNRPERMRKNVRWYVPMASAWVLEQERFILANGIPLSAPQLSDAKLVGVAHPERVRLLRVEQVPLPEHPELHSMAEAMQLTNPPTPTLAVRYGIYIRSDFWEQRWPLVHELAHTAQYERLGGVRAFLECYLYECLAIGPTAAPMEQEAITLAQRICGQTQPPTMPTVPLPKVPTAKSAGPFPRAHNPSNNSQIRPSR